jgi:hypothetical protein
MTLTPFERIILDALVAGDTAELAVLREQVAAASATAREFTGVGFFATWRYHQAAGDCRRPSEVPFPTSVPPSFALSTKLDSFCS